MEKAWGPRDDLAKRSINALVGLWGIAECYSYKLFSSSYKEDAPRDTWAIQTFAYPGGMVHDFILRTRLACATSHRPLHDLCLCTEAD